VVTLIRGFIAPLNVALLPGPQTISAHAYIAESSLRYGVLEKIPLNFVAASVKANTTEARITHVGRVAGSRITEPTGMISEKPPVSVTAIAANIAVSLKRNSENNSMCITSFHVVSSTAIAKKRMTYLT